MDKKIYLKPSADFIAFYSEEELTADLNIQDYVNESSGDMGDDLGQTSGNVGVGDGDHPGARC